MPLGGVAQSHEGHRYGRAEPILTTGGLAEPTKRSATFRAKLNDLCLLGQSHFSFALGFASKVVVDTAHSAFSASCVFGFAACLGFQLCLFVFSALPPVVRMGSALP